MIYENLKTLKLRFRTKENKRMSEISSMLASLINTAMRNNTTHQLTTVLQTKFTLTNFMLE